MVETDSLSARIPAELASEGERHADDLRRPPLDQTKRCRDVADRLRHGPEIVIDGSAESRLLLRRDLSQGQDQPVHALTGGYLHWSWSVRFSMGPGSRPRGGAKRTERKVRRANRQVAVRPKAGQRLALRYIRPSRPHAGHLKLVMPAIPPRTLTTEFP